MSVATPYIRNLKLLIPITIDCTAGPVTVDLFSGDTAVSYIKIDATANVATLVPPEGYTIQGLSSYEISVQGVTLQLLLVDTDWGVF